MSYPGNGFITVSLSLQFTHEAFFAQRNSFLASFLQLSIPKTRLNSIPLLPSSCSGRLASRNWTPLESLQFLRSQAHVLAAWPLEDSTHFNSSAPKLISWQHGLSKTRLTSIPLLTSSYPGSLASRRLDSTQFLCSQAHVLAAWPLETRLNFNSSQLNSSL
jgi:hypothetical protein